jgi:hypothetical protein
VWAIIILECLSNVMADGFIVQDLYMKYGKKLIKSDVKPLTCHVCKKELNGISITAKTLKMEKWFSCAHIIMPQNHTILFW